MLSAGQVICLPYQNNNDEAMSDEELGSFFDISAIEILSFNQILILFGVFAGGGFEGAEPLVPYWSRLVISCGSCLSQLAAESFQVNV